MSTVKSKNLQVGTDATASNNFTIYQPSTPDGTLRVGVGNADSPTEVGRFDSNGYVPANAPAFHVLAAATSVSNTTWTKIAFNNVQFDTTSDFDTSNYRFTPSVAGYYYINSPVFAGTNTSTRPTTAIYKNGVEFKVQCSCGVSSGGGSNTTVSAIVYLNGSTDYVEIYFWQNVGSTISINTSSNVTWFEGHLIQQA